MSARLFVEGYEADTLGDIDVEFTFSVADISDIERRNTSFSKTLTLLATSSRITGGAKTTFTDLVSVTKSFGIISRFSP